MAYILGVNPAILGDAGMDTHSVFMATAISAAFASVVMGLVANYPVALAPGMGVNAFICLYSCIRDGVFLAGCISCGTCIRYCLFDYFCYRNS